MKKILILLLSLLIFNFSFSWEKIRQLAKDGDLTPFYMLAQVTDNNFSNMLIIGRNEEGDMIAVFMFGGADFPPKEISVKLEAKNGINEVNGFMNKNAVLFHGKESFVIIRALRDSDVVKFNIDGVSFGISGIGFTKLYKEAYWKDFELDRPSRKPEKGEKTLSLAEGVGEIEAEDDIWHY